MRTSDQGQEIHPQDLKQGLVLKQCHGTNSDYFENGIWVSPGHLPSREVHRKSEPHDVICSHGDVDVQMLLPFIFEQLLRLYLPIHACTSISVYL